MPLDHVSIIPYTLTHTEIVLKPSIVTCILRYSVLAYHDFTHSFVVAKKLKLCLVIHAWPRIYASVSVDGGNGTQPQFTLRLLYNVSFLTSEWEKEMENIGICPTHVAMIMVTNTKLLNPAQRIKTYYRQERFTRLPSLVVIKERPVVNKERLAGYYRLSAYYLAKTISELIVIIMLPICSITTMYWMAGLNLNPLVYLQFVGLIVLSVSASQVRLI